MLYLCLNAVGNNLNEEVYQISDFVVTDKNDKGYFSESSTSVTKTNELIKNTPVNVTILNQELLDDLGINTTEDLALAASSIDTDPTSYSLDQIRIRGFRNTFTRFNGFRRTLARDGYNIARYDIIKGSNSMIFGQASPGGTVNAIPLIANFRKNSGSLLYAFGNKDYHKKSFNYNKIINENLAVRLMLVDHYQGYEHDYKNYGLESSTIALNYRPNHYTSLQAHIEKINSSFSFPSLSLKDDTRIDDSFDNVSNQEFNSFDRYYDGYLSNSENRSAKRDFHVPFSGEWLDFADDKMLFNLFWHTRNNGNPNALSNDPEFHDKNGLYPQQFAPDFEERPEAPTGGDFLANKEQIKGKLETQIEKDFNIKVNLDEYEPDDISSSFYQSLTEDYISLIASEVRNYLKNYYSLINDLNYGYQSGPDKNKTVSGSFNTLSFQKVFNNGLELSISGNYQEQNGKSIARDSYGISRVKDYYSDINVSSWPRPTQHIFFDDVPKSLLNDTMFEDYYKIDENGDLILLDNYYTTGQPNTDYERALHSLQPEPYIRTYWTKTEGTSKRQGLKSTLLYEKILDLPLLGKVQNKFLLGVDNARIKKSELRYDQIPDFGGDNEKIPYNGLNPLNPDGSYLNPYINNINLRTSWLNNSKITDRERAFEYIRLNNGFGSDRSILQFNDLIESDFIFENEDGKITGITTGLYREDPNSNNYNKNRDLFENEGGKRAKSAKWQESTRLTANIQTNSQWISTQSSLYDGRLRSLLGLRFDKIKIETSLRKTSLFGDGSSKLFVKEKDGNHKLLTQDQINQRQKEIYTKVSPSLGALFWANKNIGIFANFAQSIESPTGQERTPIGTLPDPEIGEGTEFGIRFSSSDNSLEAQLAYYSIKKENDNEFKYSDAQLLKIYPYEEIIGNGNVAGTNPELIYIYNTENKNIALNKSTIPGRRANGDQTLSRGIELDINYNPSRNLNFIASFNHNIENKVLKIHPKVQDWMNQNGYDLNEQIDIFGRPNFRGSFTSKYSFRNGILNGLSCGISQYYRSGSNIGSFFFYFDKNNKLLSSNDIKNGEKIDRDKTQKYYLKSKPEHNTVAFLNYKNHFRSGSKKYNYSINFRVNNLFNIKQFINRSNHGFYRESRSYVITTKIMF